MSTKLPTLTLKNIKPLTDNQRTIFESFTNKKNITITGSAGTGKTYVSLYLALNEMFNKPVSRTDIYRLVIIRSAVPTRDVGFLPGDLDQKMEVYEEPYKSIVDDLFEYSGMYDELSKRDYIRFMSTSYMRGLTIDNSIVIVDETQNMSAGEINTIMTRLGQSSRIIFCGDFFQSDLTKEREKRGLKTFLDIISGMNEFDIIEMNENDIVRSALVKHYIMRQNEIMRGVRSGSIYEPATA